MVSKVPGSAEVARGRHRGRSCWRLSFRLTDDRDCRVRGEEDEEEGVGTKQVYALHVAMTIDQHLKAPAGRSCAR